MDVTPLIRKGQQIIQSYAGGSFKISGRVWAHPVLVTSQETVPWDIGSATSATQLETVHFHPLVQKADDYDVFLLGCGKAMAFLPLSLKKDLKSLNFNVDVMETGAACRTYNVLMAEGRRIMVALLPV